MQNAWIKPYDRGIKSYDRGIKSASLTDCKMQLLILCKKNLLHKDTQLWLSCSTAI